MRHTKKMSMTTILSMIHSDTMMRFTKKNWETTTRIKIKMIMTAGQDRIEQAWMQRNWSRNDWFRASVALLVELWGGIFWFLIDVIIIWFKFILLSLWSSLRQRAFYLNDSVNIRINYCQDAIAYVREHNIYTWNSSDFFSFKCCSMAAVHCQHFFSWTETLVLLERLKHYLSAMLNVE